MIPVSAVGLISRHGPPLIIDFDFTFYGAGTGHVPAWHSGQKSAKPEEVSQRSILRTRFSRLERCAPSGWPAAGLFIRRPPIERQGTSSSAADSARSPGRPADEAARSSEPPRPEHGTATSIRVSDPAWAATHSDGGDAPGIVGTCRCRWERRSLCCSHEARSTGDGGNNRQSFQSHRLHPLRRSARAPEATP